MTPRQWMLAAVGRLQERGDTDLARQLADAERCSTELLEAAQAEQARADKWGVTVSPAFTRAIANMERVKG